MSEEVTILSILDEPVNDLAIHCPLRFIEEYIGNHTQYDDPTLGREVIIDFIGRITHNGIEHDLYACNECGFQMLVKVLGIGFYEL